MKPGHRGNSIPSLLPAIRWYSAFEDRGSNQPAWLLGNVIINLREDMLRIVDLLLFPLKLLAVLLDGQVCFLPENQLHSLTERIWS